MSFKVLQDLSRAWLEELVVLLARQYGAGMRWIVMVTGDCHSAVQRGGVYTFLDILRLAGCERPCEAAGGEDQKKPEQPQKSKKPTSEMLVSRGREKSVS